MKKILVIGSSNIDFVLQIDEMPRRGETIQTTSFHQIPGGKGANQACACGRLGGDCTFLSAVGCDGLGDRIVEGLRGANVDVERVLHKDTLPTGMAIIAVNKDGDNCIMVIPGANADCTTAYFEANRDCISVADVVMAQLETPAEAVYQLLEAAKCAGKITILNPAPAPSHIPDAVLSGLDYITPNETELAKLTGMRTGTAAEISVAAEALRARGVRNVLVTIGARGALLCSGDGCEIFPPFKAQPVDTTAAGDTFNAGFAVGLAEGKSLRDAITLANAAAAISITRKGAQTSIPTRKEVEVLLASALKKGGEESEA